MQRHFEKKREKSVGLQRYGTVCTSILTEEKEGKLVPSAVAQEYQERFEEVMIDEYQDGNLVQNNSDGVVKRSQQDRIIFLWLEM